MDRARIDRQRILRARGVPADDVKFFAGNELADRDRVKGQRNAGAANARFIGRGEEIRGASSSDDAVSISIQKKCSVLIDSDGVNFTGIARSKNARHKDEKAAEAVARVEVRVGDDVAERRDIQKTASDDDLRIEGIGERSR